MDIIRAEMADLNAILAVQRLAFQEQARLINNYSILPLTESLEEVQEAFRHLVILKAVGPGGLIIGSVRGRQKGDTCDVGRLFVHPDYQHQGFGTRLLTEIEMACPKPRYELFTSNKSVSNLRLYEKMGYVRYKEVDIDDNYKLVYMEKLVAEQVLKVSSN